MGVNQIVIQPALGDTLTLTSVAKGFSQPSSQYPSFGFAVYTGTITNGLNNGLVGYGFTIAGFTNAINNGAFVCIASTATTLTLNNAFAVAETHAATAQYAITQGGVPSQYATKVENLMCNQQGDNVYVNAATGDCLVAIAIGLKSLWPFDQLHGESPAFGFLQGLNDFNANPTISDSATAVAATITGVAIQKNVFVVSAAAPSGVNTVYTGFFTGGAANAFVGFYFTIAGFLDGAGSPPTNAAQNNGTYLCTASTATQLTLANSLGVLAGVVGGTATDYVLTVTASNSFAAALQVRITGTQEPWLNGLVVAVVSATGSAFTANYPTWSENYTNAADIGTATPASGNTWTLATNLNLVDSDYTPGSYPPTNWPSSKWSLDGYYPSIYIWVAQNVIAGPYNVNLNSCYQNGIDAPQDLAAGKPIFDGGVTFQVLRLSGAATSGAVDSTSIGTSTATQAAAPGNITVTGGDGDILISVGLMKSGNTFSVGTTNVTAGSPPPGGAAMLHASSGKLVGSMAHYIVETALVAAGSGPFQPNFSNPYGYEVVVGSISIKSN